MDYNPYAAQINAGVSPFLVQHQMQMTSSCHLHQSHQNQPLQDGFGYPSAGIDYPALNDVMCNELTPHTSGRGGGTNNHIGNIRFRQLVNEHKLRYLAASKVDKPRVAMEVVVMWRGLDPPGRFLTKTDAAQGDDSLWHDVGDKKAREKASQCLRERTPDVMPFVKQMQEQEKKKKEDDKRKKEGDILASISKESTTESTPDPTADTIVSGITPDATPSNTTSNYERVIPNPITNTVTSFTTSTTSTTPSHKKHRTREDFAASVPTANTFQNVFDDDVVDDDDNGLTQEAYHNEMQEFLATAPKGDASDEYSVGDRSLLMMETLSTNSWAKSFQSIGSGSAMMMSINGSIQEMEETDVLPVPEFKHEKSTRSQRLSAIGGHNSISMLSDMTDLKSTRSSKMGGSKAPSNFSMLSELTDLSEGMRNMEMERQRNL